MLSCASSIVPPLELIEETERSVDAASPSAIRVVNTMSALPVPLAYVAVSLLDRVRVGVPVTSTA